MNLKNNYLLVILSGTLCGISQHPISLGFLSLFGLAPLLAVLIKQDNYKDTIKFSFLWGVTYHLIVVFWLSSNIGTSPFIAFISMLFAVLILSFNTVVIGAIWFKIRYQFPRIELLLFAMIWVSVEYIRSFGLLGFPWVSLANSQIDYLLLIQIVEYTGIYGVSFWIVLINICIYTIYSQGITKKYVVTLIGVIAVPFLIGSILYNKHEIPSDKGMSLDVLVIQPNINLFDKRNVSSKNETLNNIMQSTKNHINSETQLIIWPESAMPFHRMQNKNDRNYLIYNLFNTNSQKLLTGNIFYESESIYNSAILLSQNGIESVYHKRQLVPLAEHFPFSENFPSLKKINIGQTNFSKGKRDHVFDIHGYKVASLICFESTFPGINRRHAQLSIDALVYLVNDGWYTTAPQPQQHARQAIFRAIENRLPVIRCANTGISMIINSYGVVEKSIDLNKSGTLQTKINKKNSNDKTFYTRFGDVFVLILLTVSLMLFIRSLINK